MAETTAVFMAGLLRAVPELQPVYTEHLRDNRGELLPHVLMSDVASFAAAASQDMRRLASLRALLEYLGEHVDDNSDVRELVMASFFESLLGETEAREAMKPLMSDSLRAVSEEVFGP